MTRIARRRTMGGHDIRICGRLVNINLAQIVYKCAECFGDLGRSGMGLKCQDDKEHRGFIHRDEVSKIENERREQLTEVEAAYKIINGKIVYKEPV